MIDLTILEKNILTVASTIPLIVKPENNVFNPERHERFGEALGSIMRNSDEFYLCLPYDDSNITFAYKLCSNLPDEALFLTLPDYHDITATVRDAATIRGSNDADYSDEFNSEIKRRVNLASIFREHLLSSITHKGALESAIKFKDTNLVNFSELYPLILDNYRQPTLVIMLGENLYEISLDDKDASVTMLSA
ncbi:hypothetical protein VCHA53O466_50385 [Vibrio chagasii]|nr:hypothetical protein VCHA53O466_50385 [Vibrio chagasii]